jgi:hypothetical protein
MSMNTRQGIAYASPCFDAEATQRRRFGSIGRAGKWTVSIVLTVNVGLE